MRIISIANQKGGCGKTTTAINLASSLGRNGKKTLLIDLDPQAHASLGLNIDSADSLYNVISNLTPRKLKINDIIHNVEGCFDVVPSNILVGTLEQELSDEIGREQKLVEIIEPLKESYDYILIDCPPSLGFLTVNSIRASHEVMIPVETSRFSLQGVMHLMDIVQLIHDRLDHPVNCKALITMFDSRLRHSFAMLSKIRELYGGMMFNTIVHVNVKLKESAVSGQTVAEFDKYCRGAKDYFSLAKELISQEQPAHPEPQPQPKPEEKPAEKPQPQPQPEEKPAEKPQTKLEERPEAQPQPQPQPKPAQQGAEFSERMQEAIKAESKEVIKSVGTIETTFALKAEEAKSVYVTGSFNDWSLDESCRMRREGGVWKVSIPLKPGRYKYQFIVDGKWQEDPTNERKERNSFGDVNSLIEIKNSG